MFLRLNPTAGADPDHVRYMFGAIAHRYDLANHILSCGLDFYWRKRAGKIVASWDPSLVVDLATGTGDVALTLQRTLPRARVLGVDFSEAMLAIAGGKGVRETLLADAMQLPFEEGSVDAVTIAFGLRNLPDWEGGLREMRRVLRPHGRLLVMEFSIPDMPAWRECYRLYLHHILPLIGGAIAREEDAYRYLGDSIERFPRGVAMLQLLERSGFREAKAEPLTGGIVTIYTAQT